MLKDLSLVIEAIFRVLFDAVDSLLYLAFGRTELANQNKRIPTEDILKDIAIATGTQMTSVIAMARCGEIRFANEGAAKTLAMATRAKTLMITALKQKLFLGQNNANMALGYVEDARIFSTTALILSRSALKRKQLSEEEAKKAAKSGEALVYMVAASEQLLETLKGGDANLANKKVATAVIVVGEVLIEAEKDSDPGTEDAAAAKATIEETAKRTTFLAAQAERLQRRSQIAKEDQTNNADLQANLPSKTS